ncbi:inositol 2-dehydrogenase-like [Rhea pennata]|uniref:inositol 2-dehydrogenase-like n=1 Tax=Rhea pennata TaxID=8795 RepID=UPI002E2762BF
MGRKKKTLHDYAAEFTELAVKRHLLERGAAGEAAVVETLYCTSCELPMRVRRDRILEHLSSGRHYRNRRLGRQPGLRAPLLLVSGAIICSPPEEASEIVIEALRAGKGVFCERLPGLDRQTAEACFDEADRCGRPLLCGFYKRFDPAIQFLYKKVRDSQALGRIHRISAISSVYPAASLSFLKKSGGIFYNAAVHDIDIIGLLLGESAPDTVFSLGHAFCADMACLKDADTVAVSMKFPSGAIVTLDISQHCTKSCDQRLEVHGSQGTLRVDNQNPLGITEHGTSVSIYSQTQADRYREAHRQLFRHFLRTLKGKERAVITKEQFLWTIQVAAAAEQSWRNGSAVDLRNEAKDPSVIKTETE